MVKYKNLILLSFDKEMAVKLLSKEKFPDKKWDKKIDELSHPRVYMYSWYLKAVGKTYSIAIDEESEQMLPVFHNRKKVFKQHYMPFFAREFQFIGKGNPERIIDHILKQFKWSAANYHLSEEYMGKIYSYQYLNINQDYKDIAANYSKNTKRKLSKLKKEELEIKFNIDCELVAKQFESNAAKKIKEIKPKNIQRLQNLMEAATENRKGFSCGVYSGKNLLASGFFLDDDNHIIYLKGSSNKKGRDIGAMYYLFNAVIERFAGKRKALDFGGSNVENIAKFYKRFGAENKHYLHIKN